jgi:putative transposase
MAPNRLRAPQERPIDEVVFSDIFEVRLADGTRVRGCFARRKQTRPILGLAFDSHMRAELLTHLIQTLSFSTPGWIWHSEEAQAVWSRTNTCTPLAERVCAVDESGRNADG